MQTEPPNLGTTLNGSPIKTDNTYKKKPGVYRVMITDSCYQTEGVEITLKPSDQETVQLAPQFKKSGIDVQVFDAKKNALYAKVFIDERYVGMSPFRGEVPKCAKKLRIEHNEQKVEQSLSLKEHTISTLKITIP